MKRSLIFGLIAVLSAGLVFVGCGGSDSETQYINIGGRLVDYVVDDNDEGKLLAALENPLYQVIGVTTNDLTLHDAGAGGIVVIPADKTLVLYAGLIVGTAGLQVEGTLIVEGSGVLTAEATKKVWVTDGQIEVNNGTISIDRVAAIYFNNPGSTIEVPALGTGRVAFRGGNLDISEELIGFDDVKTAFGWVPQGKVTLTGGVAEKITPTALAALETTLTRRLEITAEVASPGDTATELTIPAGLKFTTDDPLFSLTSLTVLGELNASAATLASVVDLTVAGGLLAAQASYTSLTDLIVSNDFEVGVLSGIKTLTVDDGEFIAVSVAGDAEAGLTLKVEEKGEATIDAITGLKEGVIAGILTAEHFENLGTPTTPTLTATAGALVNGIIFTAPEPTVITELAAGGVTTGDFVVPEGKSLPIPAATTLTIASGSTLTYNGSVTIDAAGAGVLKLATAGTAGAKIVGIGTITAGQTAITGAREAVGLADTGSLTITGSANGATIAAVETKPSGLKASAAGAALTQNSAGSNALTIAANTTIDLAGSSTAKLGEIILKGDATPANNGKLTLAATTSKVLIAASGGSDLDGVTSITINGTNITPGSITTATIQTMAAGDFLIQIGGVAVSVIATTSDDVVINSIAVVVGTA
jgi:hypothetical protein